MSQKPFIVGSLLQSKEVLSVYNLDNSDTERDVGEYFLFIGKSVIVADFSRLVLLSQKISKPSLWDRKAIQRNFKIL